MSIFPAGTVALTDLIQTTGTTSSELPLAKEYSWDFDTNDFLLIDGKNVLVTGKEAVKVWAWKVLHATKRRYAAYSDNYGNELETLINHGLSVGALRSEIERYLKEALLINPYIKGISTIDIRIDGSKVDVNFTATTVYGEVTITV